jgi:hypothetical protein
VEVDEGNEKDGQNEREDGRAREVVTQGIVHGRGEVELQVRRRIEIHRHLNTTTHGRQQPN